MDEHSRERTGSEVSAQASRSPALSDEDVFRALSDRGGPEDADLLRDITSRIRRSIDDPRPSLSLDQIDDFIDGLVAKAKLDGRRA